MTKATMRRAKPDDIRRLARFLKLKDTDEMKLKQLIRLLDWYFKRSEKKRRGMTMGWE